MIFLCYRVENTLEGMPRYSYCGKSNSTTVLADDLSGLGDKLLKYAEQDKDSRGFRLSGDIRSQNTRGLPKRVLEELALIIQNKSESKRKVLVVA